MERENETLYIVMPAYNEEANIEEVIRAWYPMLNGKNEASRLVIADSGSTDDTHNILMRLKSEMPKLEILDNTGKQHGPKLIALYRYAVRGGQTGYFRPIRTDRQIRRSFMPSGRKEPIMMPYSAIEPTGETEAKEPLLSMWSVHF